MTGAFQSFGSKGCEVCGTQRTAVMSGTQGRRCAGHAVDLPDTYHRDLAMALVDAGGAAVAFAWLKTALNRRARSPR